MRSLLVAASIPYHGPPALRRIVPRAPLRCLAACATAPPDGAPDGFGALGLAPELVSALEASGIAEPTEIQRLGIQTILRGGDAVLLAETGSGKTLAYGLPLLHRLLSRTAAAGEGKGGGWQEEKALILVPNRDLCAQVHDVLTALVRALPDELARAVTVSSLVSETAADADASVLIATPGVALNAIRGPEAIRTLVLDEADALLAGSFKPAARSSYPIERLIAGVCPRPSNSAP
jgi:ATP-dependent RNA helicase RhlE